jgi:hypothetical protein
MPPAEIDAREVRRAGLTVIRTLVGRKDTREQVPVVRRWIDRGE